MVKNLPVSAGGSRGVGSIAAALTPVSVCLHFHVTFLVYLCVSSLSSDFKVTGFRTHPKLRKDLP